MRIRVLIASDVFSFISSPGYNVHIYNTIFAGNLNFF